MDTGHVLGGALFDLYHQTANGVGSPIPLTDNVLGCKLNTEPLATDANGIVLLNNLAANETYYLVEIKAPAGYNLPTQPIVFTVSKRELLVSVTIENGAASSTNGFDANYTPEDGTSAGTLTYASVTVLNKSGFVLPETGGTGTLPYTAGGLLIIATASLLLYIQFKRRREGTTA